jgi:hypothetical protein
MVKLKYEVSMRCTRNISSHVQDGVARVHNYTIAIVVGCGIVWWWICSVNSASGHIKTRQIKCKLIDYDTFTSLLCRLGFITRAINRWKDTHVRVAGFGQGREVGKHQRKKSKEAVQKYQHNWKRLLKLNVAPKEGPHVTHRVHDDSIVPVPETIRTSSSNVGGGGAVGGEPRKPLFPKSRVSLEVHWKCI